MRSVMIEKGIDPATDPNSVVPTVEGVVSDIAAAAARNLLKYRSVRTTASRPATRWKCRVATST